MIKNYDEQPHLVIVNTSGRDFIYKFNTDRQMLSKQIDESSIAVSGTVTDAAGNSVSTSTEYSQKHEEAYENKMVEIHWSLAKQDW